MIPKSIPSYIISRKRDKQTINYPLPTTDPYTDLDYMKLQITLKDLQYPHIRYVNPHTNLNSDEYKCLFYVLTDRGWWVKCKEVDKCEYKLLREKSRIHSCGEKKDVLFCPHRERTVYGFINNWIVNSCSAVCSHYFYCGFRELDKLSNKERLELRTSRQMRRDVWRMEKIKFEYKSPSTRLPEDLLECYAYTGFKVCNYIVERVVIALDDEIGVSLDSKFMEQLGIIEDEMTRFKDSLKGSDAVVAKQIGFLLYMIELGKVRLGSLRSLTVRGKNGTGFVPLVKDIQLLIKDAVALMDSHGWTSAGRSKLMESAKKSARGTTLDLLEGKEGVYSIEEPEIPMLNEGGSYAKDDGINND